MTQQKLNGAQIGAGFQQVGGEGVAKRVRGDLFFDARCVVCFPAGLFDCIASDWMAGQVTREQPYHWMTLLPIFAQQLQQARRKHDIAKAAGGGALTLVPVNVSTSTLGSRFNGDRLYSPEGWRVELPVRDARALVELWWRRAEMLNQSSMLYADETEVAQLDP